MNNDLHPDFVKAVKVISSSPNDPVGSNLPNDMSPHEALHHGKNAALQAIDTILQHLHGISLVDLLAGDTQSDPRRGKR